MNVVASRQQRVLIRPLAALGISARSLTWEFTTAGRVLGGTAPLDSPVIDPAFDLVSDPVTGPSCVGVGFLPAQRPC